jgi:hypothetical protein
MKRESLKMAFKTTGDLEDDIRHALIVNIGKDYYDAGDKGQRGKIDDLAEALKGSIVEWVKRQTFQITEMEAPIHFPPTTIKTKVKGGTINGGATVTATGPMPITGAAIVGPADGENKTSIKNIAQISQTINKIDDDRVGSAVTTSEVKLLRDADE